MPYCPKCNAELSSQARYCPQCAAHFGRGSLLKPLAARLATPAPAVAEPLPSAGSVIGRIVFRLLVSAVVSVVAAVVLFLLAVLGAPFTTNLIIWIFVTGVGVIWTFTPFLDFNSGGRQDGAGKP